MSTSTRPGSLDLVEIRKSDALTTLARNLPSTLDLGLVDDAKGLYVHILDRIEGICGRSLVIAEDVHHCPTTFAKFSLISSLLEV